MEESQDHFKAASERGPGWRLRRRYVGDPGMTGDGGADGWRAQLSTASLSTFVRSHPLSKQYSKERDRQLAWPGRQAGGRATVASLPGASTDYGLPSEHVTCDGW